MFKVKNGAAIRRLAARNMCANRARNLIAALAVALTAALFTALFTVGGGMIESFQRQTMRQAGGDGMAVVKYATDEIYAAVKDHPLIEEISYNRLLADSVDNAALLKRRGEFYYMDEVGMRLGFCEPTGGRAPQKENEIMMDTAALRLLGVEPREGAPVRLELTVHGRKLARDFVLSGWWAADPAFNVSIIVASRAYVDAHLDELYNSYREDMRMTGAINCYIMFKNSLNIEGKLARVIEESGLSMDPDAPNGIATNVNWSYLSANLSMDPSMLLALAAGALLIGFAGYLIIYNIFQISVMQDVRDYGLLKTIGATGRQIRALIRRQALALCAAGIPLGLLVGFLTGRVLLPVILRMTIAQGQAVAPAHPAIFLGSAIFALATVLLSAHRPGRMAAKISPVEAARYTGAEGKVRARRSARHGARIPAMALYNLGRNRRRTALTLCSIALSLILFNTAYTLSVGFDMDKYLGKFVDTDFIAGHADFFNSRYRGPESAASERMIESIRAQPGFEDGGRSYFTLGEGAFSVEDARATPEALQSGQIDGRPVASVYGLEDFNVGRLRVLEGEIDMEKLRSGRYILEGVLLDDHEQPIYDACAHFDVGETVVLYNRAGDGSLRRSEFEVMARVAARTYINTNGWYEEYCYYLPAETYLRLVEAPGVMNYAFNVADGSEAAMNDFLKSYTDAVEPLMNFSSRQTREAEFEGVRDMFLLVGGALSGFIGFIGLLNFVNSMLTSILARRREFAMLRSIGMTARQLREMLRCEGALYALGAAALSLSLGAVLSAVIGGGLLKNLWFFSYRFTLAPLFCAAPLLLILGALAPTCMLRRVEKRSIVERLRE